MVFSTEKTRTSIPKEIKFLKSHYKTIVEVYQRLQESEIKKHLADFLSYVSISLEENYERSAFKYFQDGTKSLDLGKIG